MFMFLFMYVCIRRVHAGVSECVKICTVQMALAPDQQKWFCTHTHVHRYATAKKMDETKRELKANLQRLHMLALKTNVPGVVQKLKEIQRLAVYSETNAVAQILIEMLSDIEDRLKIINTVDDQAKKLVEETGDKVVCMRLRCQQDAAHTHKNTHTHILYTYIHT